MRHRTRYVLTGYRFSTAALGFIAFLSIPAPLRAGCLDNKLETLKGQSTAFSTKGSVRSGTCGGCCALGTCSPP